MRNICEVYRTLNRLDDAVAAARRAPLVNIGAEVRDHDDTMALLASLDLVVTVDTSAAHQAAVRAMAAQAPAVLVSRPAGDGGCARNSSASG